MGNNINIVEPRVLSIKDFKVNWPDDLVPGSRYTEITDAEGFGGFGLHFHGARFPDNYFFPWK